MAELMEVLFKGNRKEFFQWEGGEPLESGAPVIVEVERGEDFGRVHATGSLAERRCAGCAHGCGSSSPALRILRRATPEEERRAEQLREQDEDTRRKAMEKVAFHNLVMKLTDAEWQFDRRKLTIYFTAEKRVDFRSLVRDLASTFRARIELKQIGVRDEARRLGGIGRCGREYCSASWLPDLRPVNLQIAKDQRLSLNPSQISGACGRLMCCLRYEHEFYVSARKRFPKEGRILRTLSGEEKVVANDIFRERVTLVTSEGESRVVALADLKKELEARSAPPAEEEPDEPVATAAVVEDELLPDLDQPISAGRTQPAESGRHGREAAEERSQGSDPRGRRRGRRGGRRYRSDHGHGSEGGNPQSN